MRKEVANYLATLNRGEKVAVLETRGDWARLRSSDDSEGWMKRASLLELEGITEGTVLSAVDVFDRPDLLAANAKRKVEPGTLVLVVKARPPFSEVNVSGAQDVWVLTERLDTSAREVSVAKLCEKARYLVRNNTERRGAARSSRWPASSSPVRTSWTFWRPSWARPPRWSRHHPPQPATPPAPADPTP